MRMRREWDVATMYRSRCGFSERAYRSTHCHRDHLPHNLARRQVEVELLVAIGAGQREVDARPEADLAGRRDEDQAGLATSKVDERRLR